MSWLHLIFGIILLVSMIIGLVSPAQKTKIWAMVTRVCYLVLIVSGIFMTKYAWSEKPVLTVVKIIVALLVIGLIEMAFGKKTKGQFSIGIMWMVIVMVLVVGGLGLWLSGGYPVI